MSEYAHTAPQTAIIARQTTITIFSEREKKNTDFTTHQTMASTIARMEAL